MKKSIVVVWMVFVFMSLFATRVFAEPGAFSLSLAGQYIPFISGDAGKGDGAPKYDDAFDGGLGVAVEAAYRLDSHLSVLAGIGYEQFSGDSHQGVSFDDLDIMTLYLGGKYHFPVKEKNWDPYLKVDIGTVYFDSVDISYQGVDADYWDSSWNLMVEAGIGTEYTFSNLGVFCEIKVRYMDSPDASSELREYSDADSSWSIPLTIGINYHF